MDKGAIPVTAEPGIDTNVATGSEKFREWLASVDDTRFDIRSIHIQSLDMFGKKVGFIKFKADVTDKSGKPVSGIVFMRGGAVGILTLLRCNGQLHAVMTQQPRISTGRFDFCEIPAGMLDGSGDFAGVAAKEMEEELGLTIGCDELTDMTAAAGYAGGFFPSPGGCDETIRLFLYLKDVTPEELAEMNGKTTGAADENEQITLTIVPFETLWQYPDGKTLAAYTLYNKLFADK